MTINLKKCAISKYHEGFDGLPIGSNILVKKAMKACFRLRPPLPRYTHTFDIVPLLDFISSWPPNNSLTLKQLTFKAVFLTIYSTISRVSSLARLGPTVTEHDDHIVLNLVTLEKQGRPGHVRGYISVEKFEDSILCPAVTLVDYVNKVGLTPFLK